ncbi:transposase [Streptomyces sp. WC2508]|uniref:transposase n=1 Tax=unclassified Streptomyces TaxID=2593676 RepID=UPI0033F3931C
MEDGWAEVRPLLPVPTWLQGRAGQPEGHGHRQMLDAIRYLVAGGISWRAMPADFPAWVGSTPSSAVPTRRTRRARRWGWQRRRTCAGIEAAVGDAVRRLCRAPWRSPAPRPGPTSRRVQRQRR